MPALWKNWDSRSRAARLATFAVVFAAAWAVVVHARANENSFALAAATPPYALFQYSTLTGSGNTITATRLPVVTTKGTSYANVTVQFDVDASGNLTLAPGFPQVVAAPPQIVSNFVAGTYNAPSNLFSANGLEVVSGPGVTTGGTTVWSMAVAPGANGCTYPVSATWYVGPIASNPLSARIKKAGIPTTTGNLFFGVGGPENGCGSSNWPTGGLLAFTQTAKALTIESFTTYSGGVPTDHNSPVDQITYTLP